MSKVIFDVESIEIAAVSEVKNAFLELFPENGLLLEQDEMAEKFARVISKVIPVIMVAIENNKNGS